jgi:hypothetical protein
MHVISARHHQASPTRRLLGPRAVHRPARGLPSPPQHPGRLKSVSGRARDAAPIRVCGDVVAPCAVQLLEDRRRGRPVLTPARVTYDEFPRSQRQELAPGYPSMTNRDRDVGGPRHLRDHSTRRHVELVGRTRPHTCASHNAPGQPASTTCPTHRMAVVPAPTVWASRQRPSRRMRATAARW